jgi:hypothetical protein
MQYWWVNQNQTYKHEVFGGYMWSPKTNSDGSRSQFYINMTLVKPGDVVYSFCDTYIKAVGIVTNSAVSSSRPTEFGNTGKNWNDDGWFVETDFIELDSPIKPSKHMDLLVPTLPEKYSPLQVKRSMPKEKDDDAEKRDLEKCAYRAARRVRHLCLEIRADRLLTLTSRNKLKEYDDVTATWKRFMRILESAGEKFEYVAVPELHKNGEHFHIHAAINGFVRAEMLRRCWQIALGGKGDESGQNALGNVDIKHNKRKHYDKNRQTIGIARYISKYITKSYLEHHRFNRKRYWAPRSIKLPESSGEWMQAEYLAEAVTELHSRFDASVMIEANKNGIYITEANTPMIFFRYLPPENDTSPTPF